jgi:hypothetical protein
MRKQKNGSGDILGDFLGDFFDSSSGRPEPKGPKKLNIKAAGHFVAFLSPLCVTTNEIQK